MSRILALDYGMKRCGIAETDDLQLIASPVDTIPTKDLMDYFSSYFNKSKVETLVVGEPVRFSGELSSVEEKIRTFIKSFEKKFPEIPIVRINETFTSKMAMQSMIAGGMKKMKRREKGNLDKISAAIILQDYLESKRNIR